MHLSATPRRRPVPPFANHTPRDFELRKLGNLHQSSAMFGPTGLAVGPMMFPSAPVNTTRKSRKPATTETCVSEGSSTGGSIAQGNCGSERADVKSKEESRPTSTEASPGCVDSSKSPFVDDMMTQTNLLVLPPSNPSYQMAYFLKTTGPVKEPPSKVARQKRISSAMRIFKNSNRKPSDSLTAAHNRLNEVISEDNEGLENDTEEPKPSLPETVVPKYSKTGQKYFEIEPKDKERIVSKDAPSLGSEIIESRVSVLVTDQLSTDSLHDWVLSFEAPQNNGKRQTREKPERQRGRMASRNSAAFSDEEAIRVLDAKTATPVRPLFLGTKPRSEHGENPRRRRAEPEKVNPLRSHPVTPGPAPSMPPPALPSSSVGSVAVDAVKLPQLAHPSPRRLGSHQLLLQRASSDVSGLRFSRVSADPGRSISDSPGPPPPRSPLRLAANSESLSKMLTRSTTSAGSARSGADVMSGRSQHAIHVTKEAEVTYVPRDERDDQTHSFLRPGSSSTNIVSSDALCADEGRLRNGSSKPLELIDAMVKVSQQNTSRRRLRRARPDGPRPLVLSSARPDQSPEREQKSESYCTSPLSIKRATSTSDMSENYRVIATTVSPSPRVSHVRKAQSSRGRRSPAPRSKSGKRSRAMKSPTPRAGSPSKKSLQANAPDVPSPPPKKELPPTPREKSQRFSRSNFSEVSINAALVGGGSMKELPSPPVEENGRSMIFPSPPSSAKTYKSKAQTGEHTPLPLEARMEALERRNRLLEAALMAVLKTGGTLNGCPCHTGALECPGPMADGGLTARGSVRSRVSTASSGPSALDVYLNTRGR